MRKFPLLIAFLCFAFASFGQTKEITGRVTNNDNFPLANATVKAKGFKTSTITDSDGNFRISVNDKVTTL